MDQQTLRELEHRCIQEEPPPCTAACPLHVDARGFIGHVRQGRWAQALTVLHKTMPLTGILGRICDAPCRQVCNRKDAGEAICIGDLERACVDRVQRERRVMPLPKKPIQVAVVGSGLSSLTVAWDLVRKGYDLTVFEPGETVGSGLMTAFAERLSRLVLSQEIDVLTRLGVRFEVAVPTASPDFCRRCGDDFHAVYVGLDAVSADSWGIDSQGVAHQDPFSGATGREGVFAGGDHPSPVWQTASGRWCATSMDRWLQRVSVTAGREKEGPIRTRLYTDLNTVEPLPAVFMTDLKGGYNDVEALEEARRCIQCQCLECVKVCAYLDQFGGYPRTYAREIYNNESIVMGERKANRLINSCSLCGLCEAVCPNDFAMQDLCLAARQGMVTRGKMPPSAHDFALQDMAFSQSDCFALARHAPGRSASRYLFFPGCQLAASAPDQTARVYEYLMEHLTGGVALMLGCCGAPAHWAGRQALLAEVLDNWKQSWEALGRPQPILACATCLRMFKDHLPEAAAVSLWEILVDTGIPDADRSLPAEPLAIHDPCSSRAEPAVHEAVRRLVARLVLKVEELALGRHHTECCGFGGLMQNANPTLADAVACGRGRRSDSDFLAYCAMCRDNLARVGKRTLHLLDLLFPDPQEADPAGRAWPGWSRRRENRQRLKTDLLQRLWGEAGEDADAAAGIVLYMAPEVAVRLDARRILEGDLRRVIHHAEAGGPRFRHARAGHYLAVFRPQHATFWVMYSQTEDGFRVHNAYVHRMEVIGP
jgi:glutamate synthase (NADPH) small chain